MRPRDYHAVLLLKATRHRQKGRLTNRRIETLKVPGFYADGDNLYLDFKEPPEKNWVFRYKRDRRDRDMGLGRSSLWPKPEGRRSKPAGSSITASIRSTRARPLAWRLAWSAPRR